MQGQFTDKAKTALLLAAKAAEKLHQPYIGTEHILVGLLRENTGVAARVLLDNGVDAEEIMEVIKDLIAPDTELLVMEKNGYSPRALSILEESHALAAKFHSSLTGTEHILMAIIKEGDNVAFRLLNTLGYQVGKLYMELLAAMGEEGSRYKEDLAPKSNKKKEHSALEQYSRDLTALAKEGKLDRIVGRESQIQRVIQILSRRTKNNPCLVGEPGVGKTAIVEGLAQKIVSGDVPSAMMNKRLLTLDLSGMIAGSKYRGEFEERIKKLMREVREEGNILLFMDEIHTLIGAGGAEGAIDASNILKPALARGELQMIGATTISEYRRHIERDAALERRFQPVTVEEPTQEEAVAILEGIKEQYEKHHHVEISHEAVLAAVQLSSRYINDRNLPDKAIDLMDEAAAIISLGRSEKPASIIGLEEEIRLLGEEMENGIRNQYYARAGACKRRQKELKEKLLKQQKALERRQAAHPRVVTQEDIASVVSLWTKIPVKKLAEKESERLLKLESVLHQRVIGQKEAVQAVAKAMRRGRVGLQDPKRPIGSFLFLGPTGVGKTELSKALAEAMFGSEDALIRVDMSEYMESHSVSKMIGSPPGYVGFDDGGQLSEKVRQNPYSVVLFDEIEKAHPDVFNILLQVLDDGHITDSKGRKVNFKNTILIMTSNAGANRIIEPKNLGFGSSGDQNKDYERMKSNVMEEVKRLFKPEFLNRIDEIMVFHPLTRDEMKQIVGLLTKELTRRCKKQLDIELVVTTAVKQYIVEHYADAKMGARPLKRGVLSAIEDPLAEEILSAKIKAGDKVTVGLKEKKVQFKVKE
ncbi:MAG: ATP-dependent Clp protease ATP-binding subunit [Lachnospiraceae bacterium]